VNASQAMSGSEAQRRAMTQRSISESTASAFESQAILSPPSLGQSQDNVALASVLGGSRSRDMSAHVDDHSDSTTIGMSSTRTPVHVTSDGVESFEGSLEGGIGTPVSSGSFRSSNDPVAVHQASSALGKEIPRHFVLFVLVHLCLPYVKPC
jgi:hypothetical protein